MEIPELRLPVFLGKCIAKGSRYSPENIFQEARYEMFAGKRGPLMATAVWLVQEQSIELC